MDAEAVVGEQACAVDFLMEAGTAMIAGGTCDKRTALQSQTHCAAKPNAARCDERCSALRWTMHCTTSFHPSHSHEARRTQQPNPTAALRSAKTTPLLPVHTIGTLPLIPPKTPVVPAHRDRPTDCQKEYKELKNRTERAKRPNNERRATGRSGPKD